MLTQSAIRRKVQRCQGCKKGKGEAQEKERWRMGGEKVGREEEGRDSIKRKNEEE